MDLVIAKGYGQDDTTITIGNGVETPEVITSETARHDYVETRRIEAKLLFVALRSTLPSATFDRLGDLFAEHGQRERAARTAIR